METRVYRVGIDEVGRGPIAGPVAVCACAVRVGIDIPGLFPKKMLRDSKKLSEKQRKEILSTLVPYEESGDIVFGIGLVTAKDIDDNGIVPSLKEAMLQALSSLHEKGVQKESYVYLDGSLHAPESYTQETVIKGDEKVGEIALASIYAKEYRDVLMDTLAKTYTGYGFETNAGYGTKEHYEAIKNKGLTPIHRKTFLKSLYFKKVDK